MTLTITYDGSPLGFDVPPTKVAMPSRAELGNVSSGGFSPEDPAAALEMVGWRPLSIEESACTAQPRLFTGYIADRKSGRSFEQTQFVGADPRIHDTTILDLNAALVMRIITWTDGKRPEESLDDRLAWLLDPTTNYLAGPDGTLCEDTGFVQTGFSLLMDAYDYRGSYPADVLADMSTRYATLINYFVFWDATAGKASLFWNYVGVATLDCTISISNAGDDNGSTIFEPDHDARLERTPEAVYSDVIVNYANGSCYRTLDATAAAFIKRGTSISRPHIGKLATAQAGGDSYLSQHNVETDRITTTIHVPDSVVGLIQAGMRMDVKFTHLTDYTDFTSMRIVACNPRASDDLARYYDVGLELVAPHAVPPCVDIDILGTTLVLDVDTGIENYTHHDYTAVETGDTYGSLNSVIGFKNATWACFGIAAGVGGPAWISATWTIDVGPAARILSAQVGGMVGYLSLWGSDDNVTFHEVISAADFTAGIGPLIPGATSDAVDNVIAGPFSGVAMPAGEGEHQYWSLHADYWKPAFGYYPGVDIDFLRLIDCVIGTTGGSIGPKPGVPSVATTDPTVNDDADAGYLLGAHWVNETTGEEFVLVDDAPGAAVWQSTTVKLTTKDEGTTLSAAVTTLDFVGGGVTASGSGDTTTVTIPNIDPTAAPGDMIYRSGGTVSTVTAIPTMTSSTAPSGVASASTTYSNWGVAWEAFPGGSGQGSGWGWLSGAGLPQWIEYEFAAPIVIAGYAFRPWWIDNYPDRTPTTWEFQGWNGSTWDVLDSVTGWSPANSTDYVAFSIDVPISCSRYRLYITANHGGGDTAIGGLKMFGLVGSALASLPIADEGDVVTVVSGLPEWAPPSGGGGGSPNLDGGIPSSTYGGIAAIDAGGP